MIEWLNANHSAITAVATIVIASSAVITVWLTRTLAKENRLLRKAETEPEVVAYLLPDSESRYAIYFVLANVGRGPARNVEFSLDRDAKDFETHDVSDHLNMNASPKVATLLPQGERIKSFFGIATALLNEPKLRPFDVSIAYEDLKRNTYTSKLSLDVAVLDWISWLEKSGE